MVMALALMLIAALTPNIYQITRAYGPTVDYEQHDRGGRAPLWRPGVTWGVFAGAMAMLAIAKVFSAAPSEFLYFRF